MGSEGNVREALDFSLSQTLAGKKGRRQSFTVLVVRFTLTRFQENIERYETAVSQLASIAATSAYRDSLRKVREVWLPTRHGSPEYRLLKILLARRGC